MNYSEIFCQFLFAPLYALFIIALTVVQAVIAISSMLNNYRQVVRHFAGRKPNNTPEEPQVPNMRQTLNEGSVTLATTWISSNKKK